MFVLSQIPLLLPLNLHTKYSLTQQGKAFSANQNSWTHLKVERLLFFLSWEAEKVFGLLFSLQHLLPPHCCIGQFIATDKHSGKMIKVFIKHKIQSIESILSTCMSACMHTHTLTHTHTHSLTHTLMQAHTHTHACTHICMHACTHTHTHTHTHRGTHTHKHTDYTKLTHNINRQQRLEAEEDSSVERKMWQG